MKQMTSGDGLGSQETRCREYAKYKGYEVVQVFQDDLSGALIKRSGMQAMLSYLRSHKRTQCVVIIDDISRLARGLEAHLQLRAAIDSAGGILESPSIEFGEDSDSLLVENLLASVSQHQKQKNAEQTLNRMRARIMNGYWPFACPVGYRYERVGGQGKMLVRNEPLASILHEALEGYATGRFQLQAEVKRFLELHPEFPKAANGVVLNQTVKCILSRSVYAGYVESPEWGVSLRKGHHEPLISFENFNKIQQRLGAHPNAPARKNLNLDFPLRGFVICGDCGTPLTSCWSKGSTNSYPYYLCPKRGCLSYGKSVRRAVLEKHFDDLLGELQPTESLFRVAQAMFEELWKHRLRSQQERTRMLKTELTKIERQVEQFLDRIANADVPSVVSAYENRIRKLEGDKMEISEKIANCGRPLRSFDDTLRTALEFIGNPRKLWASEHFEDKRAVLKLAFSERLPYIRNEGFRTATFAFPFKVLIDISGGKKEMARPERFELPTP